MNVLGTLDDIRHGSLGYHVTCPFCGASGGEHFTKKDKERGMMSIDCPFCLAHVLVTVVKSGMKFEWVAPEFIPDKPNLSLDDLIELIYERENNPHSPST